MRRTKTKIKMKRVSTARSELSKNHT